MDANGKTRFWFLMPAPSAPHEIELLHTNRLVTSFFEDDHPLAGLAEDGDHDCAPRARSYDNDGGNEIP